MTAVGPQPKSRPRFLRKPISSTTWPTLRLSSCSGLMSSSREVPLVDGVDGENCGGGDDDAVEEIGVGVDGSAGDNCDDWDKDIDVACVACGACGASARIGSLVRGS